jgi:hypothetical protein
VRRRSRRGRFRKANRVPKSRGAVEEEEEEQDSGDEEPREEHVNNGP